MKPDLKKSIKKAPLLKKVKEFLCLWTENLF